MILLRQISEQIQRNTKDRSVAVEGLGDAVVKEGHNWQVLVLVWGCLYFPESCYCTSTKHLGHLGQTRELLKFREDTSFEKCWHEQAIRQYIYIYVISPIWVITHMAFLMVPQWDNVALAPVFVAW